MCPDVDHYLAHCSCSLYFYQLCFLFILLFWVCKESISSWWWGTWDFKKTATLCYSFSFGLIIDFKGKIWILTLRIVFTNWKYSKSFLKEGFDHLNFDFWVLLNFLVKGLINFRWKFCIGLKSTLCDRPRLVIPFGSLSNTFMRCLGCARCVSLVCRLPGNSLHKTTRNNGKQTGKKIRATPGFDRKRYVKRNIKGSSESLENGRKISKIWKSLWKKVWLWYIIGCH